MKTRQGFVSNSSSSSFVVAIPKDISLSETKIEGVVPERVKKRLVINMRSLRDVMFSPEETSVNPYDHMDGISVEQVVQRVIADMKEQTPNNREAIMSELDYELGESGAQEFIDQHKDKDIYVFEYADENGNFECTMEHGDIFKNLPHIRISHH